MHSNLRRGLFLVTLLGAAFPVMPVMAEDVEQISSGNMPGVGIEAVLNDCYSQNKEIKVEDYLVPSNKGEYLDMAFADVTTFLYIRSQPTKESEYVGKLYPGYAAKIIGPVGEWTAVESGEVTGYVKTEYITIGQESEELAEELVEKAESEGRKDPFTYAESREQEEARLQAEEEAKAEEEARERAAAEAAAKEKESDGQAVVAYACQFIGNPYVWGGSNPSTSFDCSGFVSYVLTNSGLVNTGRLGAQGLYNVCTPVSRANAQPGDLIFFVGTYDTPGVSHVGIYVGDGVMLHCGDPIQYTSINTSYWQSHFYAFGRPNY